MATTCYMCSAKLPNAAVHCVERTGLEALSVQNSLKPLYDNSYVQRGVIVLSTLCVPSRQIILSHKGALSSIALSSGCSSLTSSRLASSGNSGVLRKKRSKQQMGQAHANERTSENQTEEEIEDVYLSGEEDAKREGRPFELPVTIEKLRGNSRRVTAKIAIHGPLETVWEVLTDYGRLAEYIPSLAVNELQEKRPNGARLLQIGEQEVALGIKFRARAIVDCEESSLRESEDGIERDIDFTMVEGDFKVFKGTWSMLQNKQNDVDAVAIPKTILSYSVLVTPHPWLPVGLIEGRISREIRSNLTCIRREAQSRVALLVA
eukprot:jgi/Mesen1/5918/ME000030S05185